MKKTLVFIFALAISISLFAKDIPLKVTETEWGFEISNLDSNGKRVCKGYLDLNSVEDVYIILKSEKEDFSAENFAHKYVYDFPNLQKASTIIGGNLAPAEKDKKKNHLVPLSNYDIILIVSTIGKISECTAYSDGKNLQIKISSQNKNSETRITQLINKYSIEKERIEAEKKAEEEKIAAEKAIKDMISNYKYHNETYCYDIAEGGNLKILAYIGNPADVLEIPEKIEGLTVTEIQTFILPRSIHFQTIIIPKTIKYIGNRAFESVKIKKLIFANNSQIETIGKWAFHDCDIENLVLPKAKEFNVSKGSFCKNKLKKISIPKQLQAPSGAWGSFAMNNELEEVIFEEGCVSISMACFSYCINLRRITLPPSISNIYSCAFYGCSSLSEIIMNENKMNINSRYFSFSAFYDCSLSINLKSKLLKTGLDDSVFSDYQGLELYNFTEEETKQRDFE